MPGVIRCRFGHTSATSAKLGGTTSCPACRAEGRGRISCRVHPAAATSSAASTGEPGALAAAWAAERPPAPWRETLGDAGGEPCSCGAEPRWTTAHTALICPGCSTWTVSPGTRGRAAARIAATERRASREVAITDAQARANRVRFRAWQDALSQNVDRLIGICDPDGFDATHDRRAAFQLAVTLRAYLPEIRGADTDSELTEIAAELETLQAAEEFRGLERERANAAERCAQAERLAAWEAQQEQERQRQERQQLAAEQAERRQLEAAASARRTAARPPTVPGLTGWGSLLTLVAERQAMKAREVDAKGACAFEHRAAVGPVPAARLYGLQDEWSGAPRADAPSLRACRKHYDAAAAWMTQQGCPACVYWEL